MPGSSGRQEAAGRRSSTWRRGMGSAWGPSVHLPVRGQSRAGDGHGQEPAFPGGAGLLRAVRAASHRGYGRQLRGPDCYGPAGRGSGRYPGAEGSPPRLGHLQQPGISGPAGAKAGFSSPTAMGIPTAIRRPRCWNGCGSGEPHPGDGKMRGHPVVDRREAGGVQGVAQAIGGGPLVFAGAIHYNESHGGR